MFEINDIVLLRTEQEKHQVQNKYIILGSKDLPFQCSLNNRQDYFVYPPLEFEYVIGLSNIKSYKIDDLMFVNTSDLILSTSIAFE